MNVPNDFAILPGVGMCGYITPHEWMSSTIPPADYAPCICGRVTWGEWIKLRREQERKDPKVKMVEVA